LSAIAAAAMIAITGCSSAAPSSVSPARSAGSSSASPAGSASPSVTAPPWHLVWTDTFNGPAGSGLNRAYWKYDTGQGTFGTGEIETNTTSTANVHLDGQGNLDLTALGHGAAGSPGTAWTSGRVQTRRLFGAPAGGEMMVTASLKQPDPAHGIGYWPAFWMLGPKPGTWPTTGEIDILEDVNALSVHGATLHCGNLTQLNADGTHGPCHEGYGLGSSLLPCPGCQTAFNTYSVIVDRRVAGAEQIRWYLDGREFFSVSESKVGKVAWTEGVDHGFTILLDLAIGGSFPNAQCQCTSPTADTSSGGTMSVANVSVYTN
jgi:beta-glucanase (GH16 family)